MALRAQIRSKSNDPVEGLTLLQARLIKDWKVRISPVPKTWNF